MIGKYNGGVTLKVVVEPGEIGGFVGHVPDLPGCWSQGSTLEELRENIAEAIAGCLEARQERIERRKRAEIELIAA